MPMAARNTSGNRQSTARALNAPIEAPAATIGGLGAAHVGPDRRARPRAARQWWYWLTSHIRYSGDPAFATIAWPATLSQE